MARKIIQIFYHKKEDCFSPKNPKTGQYDFTLWQCCLCDDGTVWHRVERRESKWVQWRGMEVVE